MFFKKDNPGVIGKIVSSVKGAYGKFREHVEEVKKHKEQALAEAAIPAQEKKEHMVVELNVASVAKAAVVILLMVVLSYFVYEIRGIILTVFIAFLLAAALDPLVDKMQKWRIPRAVSVLLIYIVLFGLVGLFITNMITLVAEQVVEIAQNVGQLVTNMTKESKLPFATQLQPYFEQFYQTVDLQTAATQVQNALKIVADQLLSISIGLLNLLLVLILTFFMTVEEAAIQHFFQALFPSRYSKYISTRLEAVKDQVGYWLRGQFMVSLVSGVITYIGLALLGVEYALTLSVIAGIAMVIPVIGRVFAWLVAFPIVFNQSPMLSFWMSMYYLLLQQVENNVLVPYIMNRAVGLSPIVIMIAMMVGGQYLGVLGLVLSIPIATTAAIFVKDYTTRSK
jgi:predicted PurR-regulated permease PerM